jgi:hypothetical protein
MNIHGIETNRISSDAGLASTLATDHMLRFRAVPKTVMINQWQDDLDWVIIDETYTKQIARRLELLQERQRMLIDRLPVEEVAAAERELRDTVVDYLLTRYPRYFRREGDVVLSLLTGLAIDVGNQGADPLVAVALLASEDMLILLPSQHGTQGQGDSAYMLKAGALLFPNDWALRSHFSQPRPCAEDGAAMDAWERAKKKSEKSARLGKTPYEIHEGHVSHYMEHFADRVDRFFSQMKPGMRAWRRNWGMRLTNEPCLHSDLLPALLPEPTADNWERYGYLRSEHEVFTKLPVSGAVIFSIKTYLWKLSELVKEPLALEALQTANANLAPKMFDYRQESLPTFREFLERYTALSISG